MLQWPDGEAEVASLIRSSIARGAIRFAALVSRDRVVPLPVIRTIRRIGSGESPLPPKSRRTDASGVGAATLRELLDGVELGYWALGPRTIDALVCTIEQTRPGAIIEYGSGVSTVVLGWAVRTVWGPSTQPRVVSVEQSELHAAETRALLARAGLEDEAVVIVAPLAEQDIEGLRTSCYALPDRLSDAIGGRPADLVVIDGPVGPAGVRFGTLPLARQYLRDGATFLLDDALRDGELEIARRWASLPYARVDGIRLIEKGILVGAVRRV
jgi:hypothetical protein